MSTTAEFTVDASEFPLGKSFETLEGVTVELEKVVPTTRAVVPYLWVRGVSVDHIEAALEEHRAIQEVTRVESIGGTHLLRVDWNPAYEGFLSLMVEANVVLLSASGTESKWQFAIRGDDHEAISDFHAACHGADVPIELTGLSDLSTVGDEDEYGLTEAQREALRLAYDRGYFDSPRETTLEAIASELDISRQALSSRLRRGHRRLLAKTVAAR